MPDKDVYPEPPSRTPAHNSQSNPLDPVPILISVFNYVVDSPVTAFHDWMERQRANRKIYYYHQEFRRVPDLSQCLEDDHLCQFEADAQWRRDFLVDKEIINIIRDRFTACRAREGPSADQNCAELKEQYAQVCKGYQARYQDLGYFGTARKCLMKQKERLMQERKAAAQAQD
ncbi:NADH dehydrogenase [ubiquinone] 1 beta subcomplex subunit 10 [Pseudophryne corroboree]|uniref:NADH dehydrogenase [ubiquinone] 1 beta subcomplex subunit 10 n=1 Tax=Pseudophryne corroboree TaxID=495146 RepID=UPI003081D3C2